MHGAMEPKATHHNWSKPGEAAAAAREQQEGGKEGNGGREGGRQDGRTMRKKEASFTVLLHILTERSNNKQVTRDRGGEQDLDFSGLHLNSTNEISL